jgi:hypothetical protein
MTAPDARTLATPIAASILVMRLVIVAMGGDLPTTGRGGPFPERWRTSYPGLPAVAAAPLRTAIQHNGALSVGAAKSTQAVAMKLPPIRD